MKRQVVSMEQGFITFVVIGVLYVFLGAVFQISNVTFGLFASQALFLFRNQ